MDKKTAVIVLIAIIVIAIVVSYVIEAIYVSILNEQALSAMYSIQRKKIFK